jgi:uncharacterized protein YcfJ
MAEGLFDPREAQSAAKRAAAMSMKKSKKGGALTVAGGAIGGIAGAFMGGPAGALKGAQLGMAAGGALGGLVDQDVGAVAQGAQQAAGVLERSAALKRKLGKA